MEGVKTHRGNPLGYESIGKLLAKFALPAVVSMLVNALYNIVDQIFIGQGVGYLGNAATTIAFPLASIVLAVGTMAGAGGSAYAAIKLGEGNEREAERTLGNVFSLLVVLGLAICIFGLAYLEPILTLFGATENTMPYAIEYTWIILLGTPFNMLSIGLSNLSRTDGRPRFSMYSVLVGAVLNTILDPIYIFVFHWGVAGAAFATITSQMISAALLVWYFLKKGNMRLKRENIRLDGRICQRFLALGMSSGILQIANTVLQVVINKSLVYYGALSSMGGDVALSAMGVVGKINMILISICVGIGIGNQPILGFNRGAKQYARVKQAYLMAVKVSVSVTCAGWLLCQLFPAQILSIFGTENEIFSAFAVRCMRVYMFGVFCAGFQTVSTSYFQATGQPLKAAILSMLRQLILLVPLIVILPLFWGVNGVLYAGPISDIMSFLMVFAFVAMEMKRLNRLIAPGESGVTPTLKNTQGGTSGMKLLWRLGKQAGQYKKLYAIAILATFSLTAINLIAPKVLSSMTKVVELGGVDNPVQAITGMTLLLVGLYLLRILFRYLSNFLTHKAAWNLVEDLRVKIYNHIQNFSMSYFHDKQTGDLMSRVVNDTANFELLYAHIIPEMVTNVVTVVGVMTILLTINVRLALLTLIPVPFIVASGWVFSHKVRPNFRVSQKALAQLNAKLQDNFSGIQEIQAFGQEPFEREQVSSQAGVFTRAMLHALNLGAVFHPGVEFLSSVGTVIVVGVGGVMALGGNISVSDIVAFLLYLSLFYTPISGLARTLEEAQQALAGAERVMSVLDLPTEIKDLPNARDIGAVKGSIEFDNVSFSYELGVPVLQNISFTCKPGQMVALVGPTGVGKTTLTQLIPRFYEPVDGRILIDGVDVQKATLKSLRQNIAPVLQDTFLFNGTIEENIRYANPAATDEELLDATKAANIHDDIMHMPDQYATKVGERGMRLSGGQKQRIAIARAILRKAPIIILDEATASVDAATEREIQRAINGLAGTRTIVAIAHRLSTIKSADVILVLENGAVVQRGTHDELIQADGLYRRLNLAQAEKVL